jgi:hypothetical protein
MKTFFHSNMVILFAILAMVCFNVFGQHKSKKKITETPTPKMQMSQTMSCPPIPPEIVYNDIYSIYNHIWNDTNLTYTNVCSWYPGFGEVNHLAHPSQIGIIGGAMHMDLGYSFPQYPYAGFYQNNSIYVNQHFSFHLKYMAWYSKTQLGEDNLVVCLTNDSIESLYQNGVFNNSFSRQTVLQINNFSYSGWPIKDTTLSFISNGDYKKIFIYSYLTNRQTEWTWIYECNLVDQYPFYSEAGKDTNIACHNSATLGGNPSAWGGLQFHNSPHYHFVWTDSEGNLVSTQPNPEVIPMASTWYYLTVTDSLNQTRTDSVHVTVGNCFTWPRYMTGFYETTLSSCNNRGDLFVSAGYSNTIMSFINDTVIKCPFPNSDPYYSIGTCLVLYNKYSNRLWTHTLGTAEVASVIEILVDKNRNSFVLFKASHGYNFDHKDSLYTPYQWRHYLAKIDSIGNIKWVQSFSPMDTIADNINPITSMCEKNDSIYLTGYSPQTNLLTGLSSSPLHSWSLYNNYNFICRIRKSNGKIDTVQPLNPPSPDFFLYIRFVANNTLVVITSDMTFYFDESLSLLNSDNILNPQGYFQIGESTNEGKLIYWDNTIKLIQYSSMNYSFDNLWQIQNDGFWGYAGSKYLCGFNGVWPHQYFVKLNITDGSTVSQDPLYSADSAYYYSICGYNDLPFGFYGADLSDPQHYMVKLDTFNLPNGKPKNYLTISNPGQTLADSFGTKILIYPNPVNNILHISVDQSIQGDVKSIDFFNFAGELVSKISGNQALSYSKDFSDLPDGVYLCIVRSTASIYKKMIVKFH